MSDSTSLRPVASGGRIVLLDVLRGFAVLTMLPINMSFMALADGRMGYPRDGSESEQFWFLFTEAFSHQKPRVLFALLFGVGIMLIFSKPQTDPKAFLSHMRRRLYLLWLIGILHAVLLWYGDILSYYAPIGLALLGATRWPARRLWRVGAGLVIFPALVLAIMVAAACADAWWAQGVIEYFWAPPVADGGSSTATGSWAAFWRGIREWTPAFETSVFNDAGYARTVVYRAANWTRGFAHWGLYVSWRIAGLLLIGMAWAKAGWLLDPTTNRAHFRRLFLWGAIIGVPTTVASLVLFPLARDGAAQAGGAELALYVSSVAVAAMAIGFFGWVATRPALNRWAATLLAATGRAPITHYIGQSLVCTLLFTSLGFGLFGALDRLELYGIVVAVWVAELAFSAWWMSRFRFGPIEWGWRSLSYWARQPMRRR